MCRGSVPRYAACCDVSSGLTEPAGLSTCRWLWCWCCGRSVCGLTEVFCDVVDVVVKLSHLPFGLCGWRWVIDYSYLLLKSWSLHLFGLVVAFKVQFDAGCLVCCSMRDYVVAVLLLYCSCCMDFWSENYIFLTSDYAFESWLSVMFGLYTVLFLVFFSFCCVHVLIWKALWALNRCYIIKIIVIVVIIIIDLSI